MMKHALLFLYQLSHFAYACDRAENSPPPLEHRLFQARHELIAAIKRDGIGTLKRDEREWFVLPKGAADYFRDRGLDIAGDATRAGEGAKIILCMTLKKDPEGKLDIGPFAESSELLKLFQSAEAKKHLARAKTVFVSVSYGYLGDWNDQPLVHFPCYMVQLHALPRGGTLIIQMCSGLEPVRENWKDLGPAKGTITAPFPKASSLNSWPKLHFSNSRAAIPNFRIQE